MGSSGGSRPLHRLVHPSFVLASVLVCCAATCEATAAERAEPPAPAPTSVSIGGHSSDEDAPIPWSTLFQGAIMALVAWTYKSVRDHELLLARLDERLRTMDATDRRLRTEIDRLISPRAEPASEESRE